MRITEYMANRHAEAVRLANTKTALATAIEGKGVTVPDGTKLDGMAALVEAIESGVQSDWNQNDDTQPDYIKNRPFYTGDPVETVLVEESTVSFAENNGLYTAQFPSTFEATVGETYKVYWDGTTYECTCVGFNNMPVIGNLSIIIGSGSDTGEPFVIIISNDKGIQIGTADASASHTISISGNVTEIKKIDEKYLPKRFAASKKIFFNATNDELNEAVEHYKNGGLLYLAGRLVLRITGSLSTGGLSFYTDEGTYIFTSNGEHIIYSSITTYPSFDYIPPAEFYLRSSTANSTKKFEITVDDSGTITATEVT